MKVLTKKKLVSEMKRLDKALKTNPRSVRATYTQITGLKNKQEHLRNFHNCASKYAKTPKKFHAGKDAYVKTNKLTELEETKYKLSISYAYDLLYKMTKIFEVSFKGFDIVGQVFISTDVGGLHNERLTARHMNFWWGQVDFQHSVNVACLSESSQKLLNKRTQGLWKNGKREKNYKYFKNYKDWLENKLAEKLIQKV